MPYLVSNCPSFKCWVRREFTCNHMRYHGEFIHAIAFAVNTIPDRSLSFQVVFTGCEIDNEEDMDNVHGGAMWARMPIQALVADIELEEWPDRMEDHVAQPWDCMSRSHESVVFNRVSSSPWLAKVNHEFYGARYMFTVDYTEHEIADSPDLAPDLAPVLEPELRIRPLVISFEVIPRYGLLLRPVIFDVSVLGGTFKDAPARI